MSFVNQQNASVALSARTSGATSGGTAAVRTKSASLALPKWPRLQKLCCLAERSHLHTDRMVAQHTSSLRQVEDPGGERLTVTQRQKQQKSDRDEHMNSSPAHFLYLSVSFTDLTCTAYALAQSALFCPFHAQSIVIAVALTTVTLVSVTSTRSPVDRQHIRTAEHQILSPFALRKASVVAAVDASPSSFNARTEMTI